MSIDQKITPNWSEEYAYGKMDPISAFSHTDRTATFNFVLVATTLKEAIQLQSNVDQLMKFQYPKYVSTVGVGVALSAPPYFTINVLRGKLYNSMEGYLKDLTITPGSSDGVVPLVSNSGNFAERKYTIGFTMMVLHSYIVGYYGSAEPGGSSGFIFTSAGETTRTAAAKGRAASAVSEGATGGQSFVTNAAAGMTGADGDTSVSSFREDLSELPVNYTSGEITAAGTSTAENEAAAASE